MKKIITLSFLLLFVLKLNAQTSPIIRIVFMQTSPCCDRPPRSVIIKRYGEHVQQDDSSEAARWWGKNQRICTVSDEMFAYIETFVESTMDTSCRLYEYSQSNPYQSVVVMSTKEEGLRYSSLSREECTVYFKKLINLLETDRNAGYKNEIKLVVDAISKI